MESQSSTSFTGFPCKSNKIMKFDKKTWGNHRIFAKIHAQKHGTFSPALDGERYLQKAAVLDNARKIILRQHHSTA